DGRGGGEEAVVEAAALVDVGDPDRPVAAADLAIATPIALHGLEDRQHVLIAPAAVAELGPMVVVLPLAAYPDHAVDGAGAAEHAAARHRDGPATRGGLGLGGVEPVDAGAVDELGEADGHAREGMRLAAGLEQQHVMAPAFREAAGERGPRRPGAHNDEVDCKLAHAFLIPEDCLSQYVGSPNLARSSRAGQPADARPAPSPP